MRKWLQIQHAQGAGKQGYLDFLEEVISLGWHSEAWLPLPVIFV